MKLFSGIAAAAVIGASLIAPNPAKANGWMYVGRNEIGTKSYVRIVGRQGEMVKYQNRLIRSDAAGMNDHVLILADCSNKRIKVLEGVKDGEKQPIPNNMKSWKDVMPGMALADDFSAVCF